jgi:3-deoxy-manno-octulosonate cytidylyltransferase (CMP-KDO synthetase)
VPEQEAVIGVIPARYGSTRFPGKPLALIAGRPMIQHVYERSSGASMLSRVVVATDNEEIERAVTDFGGTAVMTSSEHRTGTDRVAEVAERLEAPYYVNIQGDEPLVDAAHIDMCARLLLEGAPMSTLAARIRTRDELLSQNLARVVLSKDGHALMFSRSTLPFPRKYLDQGVDIDLDSSEYFRHIGIYGYTRSTLKMLGEAGVSDLEELESLEQLRALWLGIPVKVGVVGEVGPCVDVPADIARVETAMGMGDRE